MAVLMVGLMAEMWDNQWVDQRAVHLVDMKVDNWGYWMAGPSDDCSVGTMAALLAARWVAVLVDV